MSEDNPLISQRIMVGNYVESFGYIEMIIGIVPILIGSVLEGYSFIHTGWNKHKMPQDIIFHCFGIPLTDEWLLALGITEENLLSEHYSYIKENLEHVHQAQNYMRIIMDQEPEYDHQYINHLITTINNPS